MGRKKDIERKIFDSIYGDHKNLLIDHQDKPDFWVTNDTQVKFGVEVTELFNNESSARLRNISNYTKELLDEKKYRHKDDIKNLKVEKIKIEKNTGEFFETNAIIQEQPKLSEYLNLVENRLRNKNKSAEGYNQNLLHYNLIIHDTSNIFLTIKHSQFYNYFYLPRIITQLLKSIYREIYLITKIGKRDLIMPLKAILFLSRIFYFHEVLRISEKNIANEEVYYNWLSEFLTYQGFKNVQIVRNGTEIQVTFGNTGFLLKEFSTVILRDYGDYEMPKGKSISNKEFIDDGIKSIIQEMAVNFGFETEMGKEIRHTTSPILHGASNCK